METTTRYVLRFATEKGEPVERPLYATVIYPTRRGLGRHKAWKLHETPEGVTSWATREAATRTAEEFSSMPDLYTFTVEETQA